MPLGQLLLLMSFGYLLTVVVETNVLLVGLSARHSLRVKLLAGVWLTACTYPVVWLVLPPLVPERWLYLLVAETFAPLAECALFYVAFIRGLPANPRATIRDSVTIIAANLCSFLVGESIYAMM